MDVCIGLDQLFCVPCAQERPDLRLQRVSLPRRPSDRVLDLLLGRATCDGCTSNLEDLARIEATGVRT